LIDAVLELLQARWRDGDLDFAMELAEAVLAHFAAGDGGFYFTSDDHEALIQRPLPLHDDATPSGNGIAAKVFGRLGHLLGEPRYLQAAEDTLKRLWRGLVQMPHGHASLLIALEESLFPLQIVIIRGHGGSLQAWHALAARGYAPRRLVLAIPDDAGKLPAQLQQRKPGDDTIAYLCSGLSCGAPLRALEEFGRQLSLSEPQENP
ncbi:MAG TPA: thioredoxin domain-containing protein, partial [Gammaproteobacteria bacterium]|nr:thioredoxin domain-containing protein [Gammaproteobacteria bacterium]